jgi:hypothetical protein
MERAGFVTGDWVTVNVMAPGVLELRSSLAASGSANSNMWN